MVEKSYEGQESTGLTTQKLRVSEELLSEKLAESDRRVEWSRCHTRFLLMAIEFIHLRNYISLFLRKAHPEELFRYFSFGLAQGAYTETWFQNPLSGTSRKQELVLL
jgi:hypothetical protein